MIGRKERKGHKVFVGCASRTGQSRIVSRKDAKAAKEERIFHHEDHEGHEGFG